MMFDCGGEIRDGEMDDEGGIFWRVGVRYYFNV